MGAGVSRKFDLHSLAKKGELQQIKVYRQFIENRKFRQHVDDMDKFGNTILYYSCINNHVDLVRYLICDYKANINFHDESNKSLLMTMCAIGNLEIVKLLIDNGCDINKYDNDGWTALFYACLNNKIKIIMFLIEKEIRITTLKLGKTPIEMMNHKEYRNRIQAFTVSRKSRSSNFF
jgi:ankyrin repeat protein